MKKDTRKHESRRILTRIVATPLRSDAMKVVTGGKIIEIYTNCGGSDYDQCDA
jgi:hypothetical protein